MAVTALTGDARVQNMTVSYDEPTGTFGLVVEAEYPVPFGFERVVHGLSGLTQAQVGSEATLNTIIGTINDEIDEALTG